MKKLVLIIMLCLANIFSFGQVVDENNDENCCDYEIVCAIDGRAFNYGTIEYNSELGYVLFGSTDNDKYCEKTMTSIFLGETKGDAIRTIKGLTLLMKNGMAGQVYSMRNANLLNQTKIIVNNSKELSVTTNNVDGKSNTAYCVAYFSERYIKYINEFQETR